LPEHLMDILHHNPLLLNLRTGPWQVNGNPPTCVTGVITRLESVGVCARKIKKPRVRRGS
jgi:hypothetical protein